MITNTVNQMLKLCCIVKIVASSVNSVVIFITEHDLNRPDPMHNIVMDWVRSGQIIFSNECNGSAGRLLSH